VRCGLDLPGLARRVARLTERELGVQAAARVARRTAGTDGAHQPAFAVVNGVGERRARRVDEG